MAPCFSSIGKESSLGVRRIRRPKKVLWVRAVEGDTEPSSGEGGDDETTVDLSQKRPPPRAGFLLRLEQRAGLSALVALATFAALLVGVLAAVPDWREMLSGNAPSGSETPAVVGSMVPSPSSPATSGVRAIDLVVRDSQRSGKYASQGEDEWTQPSAEITVHNRGTRRSVINRVIMTVEDSLTIEQCEAEGGPIAVSATYDVLLPLKPHDGAVLQVPVSQQQGADEADRFAIRFGTPQPERRTTIHIYQVRFQLIADGGEAKLPVGTAIIAVPHAPLEGDGYFWSEAYERNSTPFGDYPEEDRHRIITCMRRNSADLSRFLSGGSELSPELASSKADIRP